MLSLRAATSKLAMIALVAAGTLAASAPPASAHWVCNRWGRCWHTHHYGYYPSYYYYDYGDPYYDPYDDPYYGPAYYYGPPYYGPYYYGYGPSVSLGFTFGGGHHWHR